MKSSRCPQFFPLLVFVASAMLAPSARAVVTQITDNDSFDTSAAIDGSNVVWEGHDGNDFEIYLWDGSTTINFSDNDINDRDPRVSGINVVWAGVENGHVQIFVSDGTTTWQLTANNTIDWFPAISGTSVVWEGQDGGDFDIFLAVPPFTNPVSLPSLSIWGYLALAGCLASSAVMRKRIRGWTLRGG